MTTYRLINHDVAERAISEIRGILPDGNTLVIVKTDEMDRSAKQNALSHVWYGDIAKASGDGIEEERNFCKLVYGVPILLHGVGNKKAADEFMDFYRVAINPLCYEDKLKAMRYTPVTSLMSVKQFAEYLTILQRDILQHREIQLNVLEAYRGAI